MGVVYLATDPLLRRTVAIKILPAHDDELRERFQREARSAASLRHPNVVTIYDIGEHDGKPFIAMEFLDGESVAELVQRRAALSIDRRLALMLDLCAGLGYAHKNGIVHRDIKPGNLMVTAEGPLKILDFGLARLTSDATNTGLTRVGSVLGTPHYMSPEQVEGKVADARSDIFSVGVVLYELLTSHQAYPGTSAHVVLHNIIHLTPTPIRELMPSIPAELEALVSKALEKDPEKRYQNLRDLTSDVTRVRATLSGRRRVRDDDHPSPGSVAGSAPRLSRRFRNDSRARHASPGEPRRDRAASRRTGRRLPASGRSALRRRTLPETIDACENVLLLDADEERALQLLAQAQSALDDRLVQQCLVDARACLSSGNLSAASAVDRTNAQAARRLRRSERTAARGRGATPRAGARRPIARDRRAAPSSARAGAATMAHSKRRCELSARRCITTRPTKRPWTSGTAPPKRWRKRASRSGTNRSGPNRSASSTSAPNRSLMRRRATWPSERESCW